MNPNVRKQPDLLAKLWNRGTGKGTKRYEARILRRALEGCKKLPNEETKQEEKKKKKKKKTTSLGWHQIPPDLKTKWSTSKVDNTGQLSFFGLRSSVGRR